MPSDMIAELKTIAPELFAARPAQQLMPMPKNTSRIQGKAKMSTPQTTEPQVGSFAYTMNQLIDSTELLTELKIIHTANRLSTTNDVLTQIKNMPKITPPTPTINFSELMPNYEEPVEDEETPEKPQHTPLRNRLVNKIRRRNHP